MQFFVGPRGRRSGPDQNRPLHPVQAELSGLRSYRIGRYRVIYRISDAERPIEILLVGPRRDIYEELRKNLLRDRSRGGR